MFMDYKTFFKSNIRFIQRLGTFLFGVSNGIVIIKLLCMFNILDFNPKLYVYVDVEQVITAVNKEVTQQIEAQKITDEIVSAKLELARNKFNQILKTYVKEHNAIVFSSSKVIAGADNVTEYFIEQTLKGLK